jgi:hypothetical protein
MQVLRGMSRPVRSVSFGFVPERPERTRDCIGRLTGPGFSEFNLSIGESVSLMQKEWMSAAALSGALSTVGRPEFGDVYARSEEFGR